MLFDLCNSEYDYRIHCNVIQAEEFTLAFKLVPKTDGKLVSSFTMFINKNDKHKTIWNGVSMNTSEMLQAASDVATRVRKSEEHKKPRH